MSDEEKPLLLSLTDEAIQPVRIYYSIKKIPLEKVFQKLDCVQYDEKLDRHVWLFENEAKDLKLNKPYAHIPVKNKPIVIGSFYFANDSMYLELRSVERAVEAISFFDQYLDRSIAEIKDISLINKLFRDLDELKNLANFFEKEEQTDPKIAIENCYRQSMSGAAKEINNTEPLPLVERFSANLYTDGLECLKFILKSRQIIAMKHSYGDLNFSLSQLLSKGSP